MILNIRKETKVKHIQSAFNKQYPYLKIELLSKKAGKNEPMLPDEKAGKEHMVAIDMSNRQTVASLELQFLEKTGVYVKLYRKFCNVWIETLLTDDWSLEQQNTEGELLSKLNKNARSNMAGYVAALH